MKKQLMFLFSMILCISSFAQQSPEVLKDLVDRMNSVICCTPQELITLASIKPDFDCIGYSYPLRITDIQYKGERMTYATFILPPGVTASQIENSILLDNLFSTTCRTVVQVNIANKEDNIIRGKSLVINVTIDSK